MTDISKNAELQQSCITAVKSRFFAQYWDQEVGLQCEGAGKGFTYTISEGTLNDIEIRNDKLLLKPLSKITNEDAEKFDKLVSGSDDRDMMDTVDSSVEESILQDAETTDNGSIDIQSEE